MLAAFAVIASLVGLTLLVVSFIRTPTSTTNSSNQLQPAEVATGPGDQAAPVDAQADAADVAATPSTAEEAATKPELNANGSPAINAMPETTANVEPAAVTPTPEAPALPAQAKPEQLPLAVAGEASGSRPAAQPIEVPSVERAKSKVDELIEKVRASLNVYRGTREELARCREEIKKSENSLQSAMAVKNQAEAQLVNAQAEAKRAANEILSWQVFIRDNGGMSETNPVVQQARAGITQSQRELQAAEAVGRQATAVLVNAEAQRQSHNNLMQSVSTEIRSVTLKEVASLDKFLELMDFFGEKPVEYHRQVFDLTDQLLHEEPDVFYAQVLNSAAAIQLGRFDVPRKNLANMTAHVQSLVQGERNLRGEALNRFNALALGLAGLNDFYDGRRDPSLKQLDQAVKMDPKFLELQLLRGMVGTRLKGNQDGSNFFQNAANLNPDDPRVYRVRLDSLLASNSPPKQIMPKLLDQLLKVVREDDEPSWLTAAEVSVAIGGRDRAKEYLAKVHSPMHADRKAKIQVSLAP